MMGSESGDSKEKPVRRVQVKEFTMAKSEVTERAEFSGQCIPSDLIIRRPSVALEQH